MLIDVASGSGPGGRSETPTTLTSLSSSCLIALSVARGEAELILSAVASLIMSPSALADQYLQVTFAHSIISFHPHSILQLPLRSYILTIQFLCIVSDDEV